MDQEVKKKLPLQIKKALKKDLDKFGEALQYHPYLASWSFAMIMTLMYLGLFCCPAIVILIKKCFGYSFNPEHPTTNNMLSAKNRIDNIYIRVVVGILCCIFLYIGLKLSYTEYKKVRQPGAFLVTQYGFLVFKPGLEGSSIWIPYEEIAILEERQDHISGYKSFRIKDRAEHIYEYGFREMLSEKEWEDLYQGLKKQAEASGVEVKMTLLR